jgi:hypothetical protein
LNRGAAILKQAWREFTELLTRPVVWLVALLLGSLASAQSLVLTGAWGSGSAERSSTRIGFYAVGFGFAVNLLRIVVRFMLSRTLGGEDDRESPAGWRYLFYSLGYECLLGLVAAIYSLFAMRLVQTSIYLFTGIQSIIRIALMVALFSVSVRLAATAHSGNRLRHKAIRANLSFRHYAVYAMLALAPFALNWAMLAALTQRTNLSIIAVSLIGAIGQTLLLVFPIAVYRCLKQDGGHEARVFS